MTLRSVRSDDEAFLCDLYASTRAAEVEAWGWLADQQRAFLKQQFLAQHRSYAMQFPGAAHDIILLDGEPIGRLFVFRNDREIRLVDIALLPKCRGGGRGTVLIEKLIQEAKAHRKPLRLHVARDNPARRLYVRLGFTTRGGDGVHIEMEFLPEDLEEGQTNRIAGP
jgi:GNAT superfamily N-acetyltransferase